MFLLKIPRGLTSFVACFFKQNPFLYGEFDLKVHHLCLGDYNTKV